MAVAPGRRGRGIGTVLLDRVLDDLAATGIRLVEVKTLDRSAGYPPYEATHGFWERRGFVQVDTIDPLPGWEPGNRRPSTWPPSSQPGKAGAQEQHALGGPPAAFLVMPWNVGPRLGRARGAAGVCSSSCAAAQTRELRRFVLTW